MILEKNLVSNYLFVLNKFTLSTTRCSNSLSDNLFALGEFVIVANENKRSTGADDGSGVLYFKNIFLIGGYVSSIL